MKAVISARSAGELAVLIPHVLGYHPDESLVLVGLRAGRVVVAARVDLPPDDVLADPRRRGVVHAELRSAVASLVDDCDEGLVLGFESHPGQSATLERLTCSLAAEAGLRLAFAVRVCRGRWGSWVGAEQIGGGAVPALHEVPGVADFIYRGSAPMRSRAAIGEFLLGQDGDVGPVRQALARLRRRPPWVRRRCHGSAIVADGDVPQAPDGRLEDACAAWRGVLHGPVGAQAAADALYALEGDLALRDEIYGWLAPDLAVDPQAVPQRLRGRVAAALGQRRDYGHGALADALMALTRRCPTPDRAPVLVALALCAWTDGDGTLARVALDHALTLEPEHRLAKLLRLALESHLRPGRRRPQGLAS